MFNQKPSPTLLFEAIKAQDINATRKLIEQGVDVNYLTHSQETPLITAATVYNESIIELLITAGSYVGMQEAILHAVTQGKERHLYLTQEKVFVKTQSSLDEKLSEAVVQQDLVKVIQLIASGANVDSLHDAIFINCPAEIIEIIDFVKFTRIINRGQNDIKKI